MDGLQNQSAGCRAALVRPELRPATVECLTPPTFRAEPPWLAIHSAQLCRRETRLVLNDLSNCRDVVSGPGELSHDKGIVKPGQHRHEVSRCVHLGGVLRVAKAIFSCAWRPS